MADDSESRGPADDLTSARTGAAGAGSRPGERAADAGRDTLAGSRAGERIGPYAIVEKLGQGGMGTVFL